MTTPAIVRPLPGGPAHGEALAMLSQAMLALRSTADAGTGCAIAGSCVLTALEASDYRLLRVDTRSGALRCIDGSGVEAPYLPEVDGPVEGVMRSEAPRYDEDEDGGRRETALWIQPPAALATLPLIAGGVVVGCLLVGFDAPRRLDPWERLFLQTLADGLALALERAELRRTLEEQRRRVSELERQRSDDEEASAHLMSVVAHEIRSPLTAIKAYAEAMLENLSNPHAPRERFLGIINEECDRLTRVVSDILDLSRLEAGQRPLRLARFGLDALAREVADAAVAAARARQVALRVDVQRDLVAEADPDLVRRLLAILLGHAIAHSPHGAEVVLHAAVHGDEWVGWVEDRGPAVPTEELPYVFERCTRPRPGGEADGDGSGLGLAIARGICALHGGRIEVRPATPAGLRFEFALPLRQLASPRARRIARQVWGRADLRELFDQTVEMVSAAMEAEIVSFMLVDPDHGDLFIAASRGLEGQNLLGRRTTLRSGVSGSVAAWGRPLLVSNIETDRRFSRLNHPQYRTKSLLCVPVRVEGEVLGVLNVNNKVDGTTFSEDDLAVLAALVERVGSAVERACAHPDSERVVREALAAVRGIAELRRDVLLAGHDAVRLARATAREMRLSDAEVDLIGYVASIHDLGMTRVRERVAGAGALDPDARARVHQHPEVSVEIIRPLEYLGTVRDIILAHHERWDGRGYPRGLQGEEIPVGARILAVVDAWESMVHARPWRPARRAEEAAEELRREAGRQFDPDAVGALLRVVEREERG
uniref:GAF domain-containing protein n=1 Tax=Eiseniibacteriota bacterium TaxID=2212470 RepID=A0A832ML42_UNCEI